ncbi:MAG: hypothetical protein A2Z34_09470 [Planctomycetes bacterium RBG_16_59_8]|nr:MAG: hypothetical protein A2Z34_09470 [Planctomycetes bacterium RBG_16_59_8]
MPVYVFFEKEESMRSNMRASVWAIAIALVGLVVAAGMPIAQAGDVALVFSGEGQTQGRYNFSWNHEAKVSSEKLAAGGEEVLKAIFQGAEVKGDDSKIDKASGTFKIDGGKVSGHVKLEWKVQGNPKVIEADLDGTSSTTGETGKVSFAAKNVKVSGSWNWGGGEMAITGKASFKVESK